MDEMIGIIKIFAGTYAPQGWMFCQGQELPVQQYAALYSILGTTYGGNGQTTFALQFPNHQAHSENELPSDATNFLLHLDNNIILSFYHFIILSFIIIIIIHNNNNCNDKI